ncbi:hypothetical protein GFL60_36235 [Rhizobium leguminosarum bv. viciae]|nr:hypothetical protein [Rhizobium leguminosarum bv. viciae]
MPLTLTLSPLAGRGDVPCERLWGTERSRHGPFAPFTGRRWRQPDEGPPRRKRRDVVSSRTGGTRPPVLHLKQNVRYFCSGAKNSAQ